MLARALDLFTKLFASSFDSWFLLSDLDVAAFLELSIFIDDPPFTFPATESTRLMYIFIFEKVIYSNSHAYFISCEKVSTILETKV